MNAPTQTPLTSEEMIKQIEHEMGKEYLQKYPTIYDLHQAIKKKFGGLKPNDEIETRDNLKNGMSQETIEEYCKMYPTGKSIYEAFEQKFGDIKV